MLKSAAGSMYTISGSNNRFSATFRVHKIDYNVQGTIHDSDDLSCHDILNVGCYDATIAFNDTGNISSAMSFSGHIGMEHVTLTFGDGQVIITGTLWFPVSASKMVSGNAVWTSQPAPAKPSLARAALKSVGLGRAFK